jgi:hypothetical protein
MVIRAVDESGEELQLCSKQKKDHVCVIKTLNTELFMGGGKADVTFYCKGSNGGGCKTKRPSKVKLQVMLRYEDGVKSSYGSMQFLVRGNRRQAGAKPIRYKPELEEEVAVNLYHHGVQQSAMINTGGICGMSSGISGSGIGSSVIGTGSGGSGIFPMAPPGCFITKITPSTPPLFPSTFPGSRLPPEHITVLSDPSESTLLAHSPILPPLPATGPAPPSFPFYPSFPIYPIITTQDIEKKNPPKDLNPSPPRSRKRSIDITTPPPLNTAKRMSIGNLLNPNEGFQ